MSRPVFAATALVMLAGGAAVRINNALTFPVLNGYDAFGHFTYIWHLAATGRVPLPTEGWSFFHPPLYYALMASLWNALAALDPMRRLEIGTLLIALCGLAQAAVSYAIVRRVLPQARVIHLLAPGLMLFVPVHVYSAGFLGNEGLNAVLGALALLAVLAALRAPTPSRAALLGLALGLAMLTKFTAVAVVAGALASLVLKGLVVGDRPYLRAAAVAASVALVVCGWFYGRNLLLYGTPFKMSRDQFMVRHVENSQPHARRGVLEYVTFDPLIFRRPVWPRGFSASEDMQTGGTPRAIRESVWTGVYANAWFDGFGGWVVPSPLASERARRAGQLLLGLGAVPSALVLLGLWCAVRRLRHDGWDDTIVAMLTTFGALIVIFVQGTRTVAIPAAVKATYFTVVSVPFSFWFALGLAQVHTWSPRALRLVAWECAVLALAATLVFWQGLLFDAGTIGHSLPFYDASLETQYGVVDYAAGNTRAAARHFTTSADDGWYLGYENLAYLAMDDGRARDGIGLLRRAARALPAHVIGRPADREHFVRITRAELANSMAVAYEALERDDKAARALRRAIALAPRMPEAHYNLGVLVLRQAHAALDAVARRRLATAAAREFERALALDDGLVEAAAMAGVARGVTDGCRTALPALRQAAATHAARHRRYPVATGTGAGFSAAIGRRRLIPTGAALDPGEWLRRCSAGPDPT